MSIDPLKIAYKGLEILNKMSEKELPLKGYDFFDWAAWYSNPHPNLLSKFFTPPYLAHTNIAIGVVVEGSNKPSIAHYSACYGIMNSIIPEKRRTTHIFASVPNEFTGAKAHPGFRIMVDWLINKSPWASVIITDSVNEAVDEGIILDAKAPVNLVFGALLSYKCWYSSGTRLFPHLVQLVQAGCDVGFAIVFLNCFGPYTSGLCDASHTGCGIRAEMFTKRGLKRFFKGKPALKADSYYNLNCYRGFGHTSTPWFSNDETVHHSFLTKAEVLKFFAETMAGRNKMTGSLKPSVNKHMKGFKALDTEESYEKLVEWSKKELPYLYKDN